MENTMTVYKPNSPMLFREWWEAAGEPMVPGMLFILSDGYNDPAEKEASYESFYVGDCTPFMEPTDNDGGIGWDEDNPRFAKFIVEIHRPTLFSNPNF